jgi:hypothetical protein
MQIFRTTFAVLLFAAAVCAQANKTPAQPPSVPISCSPPVPADTCSWVTSVFSLHQQAAGAIREVAIVIADKASFQQESQRLKAKFTNQIQANPSQTERNRPMLPSPYDDSLLFEIGDRGYVTKVEVSVNLFSKIKFVPDENGVQYARATGELDRDSVNSWAFYVTGFVEGCMRSRVHSIAEAAEPAVPKQP